MSGNDNSGEKTEQPTPKKRRDAKEKGQNASSNELNKIFALIFLITIIGVGITSSFNKFASLFQAIIISIFNNTLTINNLYGILQTSFAYIISFLLLPIIVAGFVASMVHIIQIGGITIKETFLEFKIDSFNPVENFKTIFSFKNFVTFVRQIIEIIIMVVVTVFIVKANLRDIVNSPYYSIAGTIWFFAIILLKIFSILLGINLVSSIIDLIILKRNLTKQLMMTPSEVKQENKNSNGDPEIKKRRQELHRELIDDEGEVTISNSTLVLANPTHIAIVLLYSPKRFKLPLIVAKASGMKAQNIFAIAKRHEIPIIRDIWLARSLHAIGIVGRYVPSSMLAPVADIISKNLHILPKAAKEIAEVAELNRQKAAADSSSRLKV